MYEHINRMTEEATKSFDPRCTWLPSIVERGNDMFLNPEYIEPRLARFRSFLLRDGGPLEWPDCPAPDKSWFMQQPLEHMRIASADLVQLKATLRKTAENLKAPWLGVPEDMVGDPYSYEVEGKPETNSNLRNTLYASLILKEMELERHASLMDIGGGFGCLLGKIGERVPGLNLYLCDFPRMCLMATYYLSNKPTFQGRAGQTTIVFPWEYPSFAGPVDVVVNTMSFQHMNEGNLNYYFSQFQRLGVKAIFSVNRERGVKTGEVESFMPILERNGYRLDRRTSLEPWRSQHFLHVWRKA